MFNIPQVNFPKEYNIGVVDMKKTFIDNIILSIDTCSGESGQ